MTALPTPSPIADYPREWVGEGEPKDGRGTWWGPEAVLLIPYEHGAARVVGHLEADMWLARDTDDPICWGEVWAEPTHFIALPDAATATPDASRTDQPDDPRRLGRIRARLAGWWWCVRMRAAVFRARTSPAHAARVRARNRTRL